MKTLLILGSDSDLGKACARLFAKEGFDVILASRHSGEQQPFVSELTAIGKTEVKAVHFDALDMEEHRAFYQSLGKQPEVVLSVFGYMGDNERAMTDFEEARLIITTNFIGQVSILNIIAADMERNRQGTIIGISSVAGERGKKRNLIYGSAKAGLTAYLAGLRGKLVSSGVHVATILPGPILTKMISGTKTSKYLSATPDQAAKCVWNAFQKKKNIVYIFPIWRFIMLIIKLIPERIFKLLNL